MSQRFTYLRERLLPELPRQQNEATLDRYRNDLGRSLAEWYRQNLRAIRELDSNPSLMAVATASQAMTPNTPATIVFSAVTDTHGWWTGTQYVPLEPGFYRATWAVNFHDTAAVAASTYAWAQLNATGATPYRFVGYGNGSALDVVVSASAVAECDGGTTALSIIGLIFAGTAPVVYHDAVTPAYRSWLSIDYIGRRPVPA